MDIRIGQGVDVHAFIDVEDPGALERPLRLAGVTIDGPLALAGHSDADVVLHALVDALLGAAGAGDLGSLVGVDRDETAGADSARFVDQALDVLDRAGLRVGNVDLTVIAQKPRLGPHRDAMQHRVAELLHVDAGRVSIKATTTDRLGFIGRGQGVACLAIASLVSD